jgi:hypothetical protein
MYNLFFILLHCVVCWNSVRTEESSMPDTDCTGLLDCSHIDKGSSINTDATHDVKHDNMTSLVEKNNEEPTGNCKGTPMDDLTSWKFAWALTDCGKQAYSLGSGWNHDKHFACMKKFKEQGVTSTEVSKECGRCFSEAGKYAIDHCVFSWGLPVGSCAGTPPGMNPAQWCTGGCLKCTSPSKPKLAKCIGVSLSALPDVKPDSCSAHKPK